MFCFQWEDPQPNWYQTMKSYMFNKKNIQQVKCVTGKLLRKQNNNQAKLNFNADLARCENVIPLSSLNPSNERRGKCHYSQKNFTFLGLFFSCQTIKRQLDNSFGASCKQAVCNNVINTFCQNFLFAAVVWLFYIPKNPHARQWVIPGLVPFLYHFPGNFLQSIKVLCSAAKIILKRVRG